MAAAGDFRFRAEERGQSTACHQQCNAARGAGSAIVLPCESGLCCPSPPWSCGIVAPDRSPHKRIDLPTSKQLIEPVPGHPQRINSLPMSMAISPDGRYVVTVNAGYGTYESQYEQSLAVLDTQTRHAGGFSR